MTGLPSPSRADPFDLGSLDDFQPTTVAKPKPEAAAIRQVSEEKGFPSRAAVPKPKIAAAPPPQRRRRTGRNIQMNIKVTAATQDRFTRLCDAHDLPYGELLDRALDAFENQKATK